ncbi:1-acyl-sn-glycerol-3-phosphate acyltransferase [Streptomyces durbertensis]|uniref:1-acyl-sn-glycerol-3-phosphate acyltransferase n=1 Tax=Streptomyces durbertensis TaxID=2448886 RepID=A0ABR6EHZ9_9ACTN|nr:lysophospholipid acyltransferase family protein [Streptomyces durbertensis]MBB1244971.1 1-acyl-sn-glycerol-3-phosphate acyltransferase [Streptomyces durbertensis]
MSATSPWLPTAPCTPAGCLSGNNPVVGRPRRALRAAGVTACLLVGVLLAPLVRRTPSRFRTSAVRAWARVLLRAFGVRLRTRGHWTPGPALVVANHVSWLDVVLLAAVRPGRMLAKAEVARYPVLGPLARYGGTLFIERDRLRRLPGTVVEITAALRAGGTVVAFPEGSTWCGRRHGRFRHAVFQAAVDAGAVVQPVAIRYLRAGGEPAPVAAFVGEDSLADSLRRVLAARGLTAEVTALPPVAPEPATDRAALARRSADLVMTRMSVTDYAPGHDRTA